MGPGRAALLNTAAVFLSYASQAAAIRDVLAHYDLAMVHANFSATLGHVRKTTAPPVTAVALVRDPWFDGVRGKPEFQALLRPRDKAE